MLRSKGYVNNHQKFFKHTMIHFIFDSLRLSVAIKPLFVAVNWIESMRFASILSQSRYNGSQMTMGLGTSEREKEQQTYQTAKRR